MSDLTAALSERTLGDWAASAACRGVNPNIFHPDDGDYTLAHTYCDRCPVRADCLTHALTNNERDGMWGGRTERARQRMRATAHMAPPPDERAPRALQLYDDGMPIKDIARRVNAGTPTVTAWLQDAGINTHRRDTP